MSVHKLNAVGVGVPLHSMSCRRGCFEIRLSNRRQRCCTSDFVVIVSRFSFSLTTVEVPEMFTLLFGQRVVTLLLRVLLADVLFRRRQY